MAKRKNKKQIVLLQRIDKISVKTELELTHAKALLKKSNCWEISPDSDYEVTENGDIARKPNTKESNG
jgi:hypothetical protein